MTEDELLEMTRDARRSAGVSLETVGSPPADFSALLPAEIIDAPALTCVCGEPAWLGDQCRGHFEAADRERRRMDYARRAPDYLEKSIPSRYAGARLDDAETLLARVHGDRRSVAAVQTHLREPWVAFVGPSGAGKTTLAIAGLRARVRAVYELWRVIPAFRLSQARIQHSAGQGEAPLVEAALRSPFVLLDDLGSESHTANNPLGEIVQERDAENRATWITTGLSRADLGNRYGGGVARRILERSRLIKLGGLATKGGG